MPSTPDLRLLHFNDVYHIQPRSSSPFLVLTVSDRDPVGGAARFVSAQNEYRSSQYDGQPGLITLFSGDAFNPSIESSVTKVFFPVSRV